MAAFDLPVVGSGLPTEDSVPYIGVYDSSNNITAAASQWFKNASNLWVPVSHTNPLPIEGKVAHDAAASGNPVQVGGVYRSADPALSDGDLGSVRLNAKGEAMVELAGTITPTLTRPNVTTTSSTALAANADRKYAILINRNPVNIDLSLGGTAVAGQGLFLPANGGSWSMSTAKGNLYTGAITAIHTATGITYQIDVIEGEYSMQSEIYTPIPTAEINNTSLALNRHFSDMLNAKVRQCFTPDVYQRALIESLGKGYNSADVALDLSADVVDGMLGKLVAQGRTITNLATFGGCEATAGWSDYNGDSTLDSSNKFEGTYCIKLTIGAGKTYVHTLRNILSLLDPAKYYLISCHLKNGNATSAKLSVECVNDAGLYMTSGVTSTSWTRAGILLQPSNFDTATQVYLYPYVSGTEGQYAFFDAIQINEISAAEYALGATACMAIYPFILGTKSTPPQRVKSVGKNLLDKNKLTDGKFIVYSTGDLSTDSAGSYCNYTSIKPSATIFISGKTAYYSGGSSGIAFYDANKAYISGTNTAVSAITVPSNARYFRASVAKVDKDTFQIEYASAATAYVPHESSVTYTTKTLQAVPAAADEIDLAKGIYTKRVNDWYTLQASDITALDTSGINVDHVKIPMPSGGIPRTVSENSGAILTNFSSPALAVYADNTSLIGKHCYGTGSYSADTIIYVVAKGTYANLAAAQASLAGTQILYQLATPTITYFPPVFLNSYTSGSLIVEPVLVGTKKPDPSTGKITITDSDLPATAIIQVMRHDVQADGTVEYTDVTSNCTLTDSGTTITITSFDSTKPYSYQADIDSRYNPGCDVITQCPTPVARHDYGAAATDWTLTDNEEKADILYVTNAGGAATIIAKARFDKQKTLINSSGQTITTKKSGGTGVALGTGKMAHVAYNGTDFAFVMDSNS